jgi:hypothetical protein
MKRNNEVECVLDRDAEESDEPVTVVCSRYEREGKPLSLIRTCQELVLAKSHSEDISWRVEVDNLPASRIFVNELDGGSGSWCICNRVFYETLDSRLVLLVEGTSKGEWLGIGGDEIFMILVRNLAFSAARRVCVVCCPRTGARVSQMFAWNFWRSGTPD